jgi:hypothetical protein
MCCALGSRYELRRYVQAIAVADARSAVQHGPAIALVDL